MQYTKQAIDFSDQLSLLKQRNHRGQVHRP